MPADTYTLDDLFSGAEVSYSLDELFATPQVYTLDDLFTTRKKKKDMTRFERERAEDHDFMEALEQFGRGFAKEASFGLTKYLWEKDEPDTTWERLARGIGSFAGFLFSPIPVAGALTKGAAKLGTKLAPKTFGAISKALAQKTIGAAVGRTAVHLGKHGVRLGVAEAISDITEPETMGERFLQGTKIGAIYGLAGMTHVFKGTGLDHVWKYKVLNQVLSQFTGRAMLAATGDWSPEMFQDKEHLAETIFHEAMNTFFLSRGMNPMNVITGDLTPYQKKVLGKLKDDVKRARQETEVRNRLEVPGEMFHRPVKATLDVEVEVEGLQKRISRKEVDRHKKSMEEVGWEDIWQRPRVRWNEDIKKFEIIDQAELLQAMREHNAWRETRGLDPIVDVPVTIISSPSEAVTGKRVPRIPDPVEAAFYALNKRGIGAADINRILSAEYFAYDVNKKQVRLLEKGNMRLRTNEIRYRFNEVGDISPDAYSKKIKDLKKNTKKWEGIHADARKRIEQLRDFPLRAMPSDVHQHFQEKLNKLDIPVKDVKQFYQMIGLSKTPRMADLAKIESTLHFANEAPLYLRMPLLMEHFKAANDLIEYAENPNMWQRGKHLDRKYQDEWADPKAIAGMREKQLKDDVLFQSQMYDRVMRLKSLAKKGAGTGSLLGNLMKVGWFKRWLNIGKLFEHWTISTGLPWWQIGRRLKSARRMVDAKLETLIQPLIKYKRVFTPREEAQIYEYYERRYARRDMAEIERQLSQKQKEFITDIDKVLSNIRPNISYYRVKNWLRLWKEGKAFDPNKYNQLKKDKKHKAANKEARKKIFMREELPAVQEALHQAILVERLAESQGMTPNDALMLFATRGAGSKLGVIEEGVYLPRIILGRKPGQGLDRALMHEEFRRHVDVMGRSAVKSRGEIKGKWTEGYLEDAMEVLANEQLVQRIHSYMRQVLNLTHLEPHLETLETMVSLFEPELSKIKGLRGGFDFMNSIRLYAHRKKGLPVQMGGIGALLKGTQSLFFRVLTAGNPYLWVRNIFQRKVTVPHKEMIFDPRYMGRSYKKNIPENIKAKFEVEVTQMRPIEQHYLFTEEASRAEKIPVIGWLYKLAKPVGKVYALTDFWNRRSVFTNTFLRSQDYINKYLAGRISADYLEARLGLNKVDPLFRKMIRYKIARGDAEGAAYELGYWMSDNSQWIYERSEKSLHEMTAEGEAWTNLITWTKSILQSVRDGTQRMYEGIQTGDEKKIMAGAKWGLGTMLAGQIANQMLRHISLKHGNKYNDYGLDMFFWEMGGVSGAIVRDFTEALANLATSIDEPEEIRGQAFAKVAKFLDNTIIRQLIPFMKWGMSIAESIGGVSYIQPVQNLMAKKQPAKVDRTILEGFVHGLLTTDPTKSPQVRRWTHNQAVKFRQLANTTKAPPLKAFYEFRAKRYEYLADLFSRFQPIEVFEAYRKKEIEKFLKQFEEDTYLEEIVKMNMSLKEMERKYKMGYY